MSGMQLVTPLDITDAMLTSTDVTEADYAAYNPVTVYAAGARVIVTTPNVHKIFESLQAANTGHDPTLAASAAWWIEVSPTNRWKLFDTSNSSQTSKATSMTYTVTPGATVNAVYIGNAACDSFRLRLVDPLEGTVYDETTDMRGSIETADYYDYFFGVVTNLDELVTLDLPAYPNAVFTVDFTALAGDVECGVLLFGYQRQLATGIRYGARTGIQDYSRIETNDYGDTVLTPRAYAKRAEFAMRLANAQISIIQRLLASVRARPCLWVGHEPYALTTVLGFYEHFDITISYPNWSDCTLSIRGMT